VVNRLLGVRLVERLALRLGGMDARRSVPRLATQRFRAGARTRGAATAQPELVWADSFTDYFSPQVGHAALDLLEAAGYRTVVPGQSVCCGLTWISTGQLTAARQRLRKLVEVFHPFVAQGIPVLGLEPSCTATLRSDLVDLLPDDPRAKAVAAGVVTLAELLARAAPDADWSPPRLDGTRIVAQPHCHQHAVMGYGHDEALLTSLGAEVTTISGCCGLAGNFGMERGHYDVSVAVAENGLLPALRDGDADAVYLADGFSCRVQGDQLAHRSGVHLAELLAERLPGR
jgi:Fe-S oxidoreductase